jgi:hypothetical protein
MSELACNDNWQTGPINCIWHSMNRFRNLAPAIHRQRLVIEGYPKAHITDGDIKRFLSQLSLKLNMRELIEPVTHRSDTYGWAGWIHWETSGAHFYAWDQPLRFFSVDIYTCKPFDADAATQYTKRFFAASEIAAKGF